MTNGKQYREKLDEKSKPESAGYVANVSPQQEVRALQASPLVTGKPELGRQALGATSVAIEDDRIVVAATLLSAQSVQKLIDKLSAVKGLLPPAKPGDKVVRMCPENQLKEPVRAFGETFSAETVVMATFFPEK